jgi:ABC-2 type transport system permease protein
MTGHWRAIRVVWHRELLRFAKDRPRLVVGLMQPVLYLFVMGTGIGSMVPVTDGVPFRTFLFPGVLCMAVLLTCFFSAGSLVWDRELGFMREMMVAPVRRSSILVGKCLGGMTAGTIQGSLMIVIGVIGGVPMTAAAAGILLLQLLVVSFALTAFGVAIATRIRSLTAFMAIVQMVLLPMFFGSGALYPLHGLPTWLEVLTRLDPLSYVVAPIRATVLSAAGHSTTTMSVTWGSFEVPGLLDLALVAASSILTLAVTLRSFGRNDV